MNENNAVRQTDSSELFISPRNFEVTKTAIDVSPIKERYDERFEILALEEEKRKSYNRAPSADVAQLVEQLIRNQVSRFSKARQRVRRLRQSSFQ